MSRISQEELERYLWSSAVLLRTHIDAGAYKQYIFPLLFFKRICDVYDEECTQILKEYDGDTEALNFEENHRFIVPQGAHWQDVRSVSENVGVAIVKALRAIEKANIDKLQGVFGNAAWTNKKRLSDELLKDLIEHFSSKTLSIANCPEDELGQGYEYLIKQFADDSGHTAQEFYTNRTVVHLMTEILKPQSGESVYDPTCGSAGMLISCIAYLQHKQQEWRNVKIFGQEITQLTAAIAKMNLFLHGIKDFNIINDDTLTVIYLSDDAYSYQYELDLIKEMSGQRKGNKILAVGNTAHDEVKELVDYYYSFNGEKHNNVLLGLDYITVAQCVALYKSLSYGITPDNPCPSGEVNRVVKGVILYPYSK